MPNVAMLSAQKAVEGLLVVSSSSDINGSVIDDTIVQKNCSLHIRGNLLGSLTIEFWREGRYRRFGRRKNHKSRGQARC